MESMLSHEVVLRRVKQEAQSLLNRIAIIEGSIIHLETDDKTTLLLQ
jgi:hypothetical protein